MARHVDPRGQDERIAAELRAAIMSGTRLGPGTRLETNQQLRQRYNVSSGTAGRAIQKLKAEGLVTARRGDGVYVQTGQLLRTVVLADGSPDLGRPEHQGIEGDVERRVVSVTELTPGMDGVVPAEVRRVLGDSVVERYQLVRADGEAVKLVWVYVPMEIAAGSVLMGTARVWDGFRAELTRLGFPSRRLVDRVTVRMPTEAEYVALELGASVPVIRAVRVVYSDGGRAVGASVTVSPGNRVELMYEVEAYV